MDRRIVQLYHGTPTYPQPYRQSSSASQGSDSFDLSGSGKFSSDNAAPISRSSSKSSGFLSRSTSNSSETSRNVTGSIKADSAVLLECENKNMAAVTMGRDGTLSLAQTSQAADSFIWQWRGLVKYGSNEGVFFSLESEAHSGLYIAADTSGSYIVKGMTNQQMPHRYNSYWRSREFGEVSSWDKAPSTWIALQYWGDDDFRPSNPSSLDGYYLVVEGQPPSTVFRLADRDSAAQHGAFSFGHS